MVTTTIGLTYGSTVMKRSSQPVWRFIRWWCLDHYHRCDVWSGDVLTKTACASFYLDVMSWPPHLVRRFFGGIVLIRTVGFTISPMIWLGRRRYCIFIIQLKSSIILILIALVSWLHQTHNIHNSSQYTSGLSHKVHTTNPTMMFSLKNIRHKFENASLIWHAVIWWTRWIWVAPWLGKAMVSIRIHELVHNKTSKLFQSRYLHIGQLCSTWPYFLQYKKVKHN